MSNYFSHFPKVDYDIDTNRLGETHNVVDILRRFIVHPRLVLKTAVYYEYNIQDGERPDTIAAKYYGDSKYDWVVLVVNTIIDPNYNWPLSYENFGQFIVKKYGSIAAAQQETHHYEQIIRAATINALGGVVPETVVKVDLTVYNTLAATDRKLVTSYDYEKDLNESRRQIRIMDKKYLTTVLAQAESMFSNG